MGHYLKHFLLYLLLLPIVVSGQITGEQVQDTINANIKSPLGVTSVKKTFTFLNQFATQADAYGQGAVPSSRQISAGTGLLGGGDLTVDRTLSVAYGTTGTTAAIGNDFRINNGQTAYTWGNPAGVYTPMDRTITAGTGLTGGGDLFANRTFAVSYGTIAGTSAQGNDSRINNGQTAFGWGDPSLTYTPLTRTFSAGTGLTGGGDFSANRSFAVSYGTSAGTAAQGNDSRINNGQTAFSWGDPAGVYAPIGATVNLTGSQTASGSKTWSNTGVFTDTYANGQATFGATGQGGLIKFKEGTGGTDVLTVGVSSSSGSGGVITSTSNTGLILLNNNTNGSVNINQTGSSGKITANVNSGQALSIFNNGSIRIGTATSPLAGVHTAFEGSATASSGAASGIRFAPTIIASANNDQNSAVTIAPTFNNGAFTGVGNYALNITGRTLSNEIIPNVNNTYTLGSNSFMYSNLFSPLVTSSGGLDLRKSAGSAFNIGNGSNSNILGVFPTSGEVYLQAAGATPTNTGHLLQINGTSRITGNSNAATGSVNYQYNTSDETNNYERFRLGWASGTYLIGSEKGGTGVARGYNFTVDGLDRIKVKTTIDEAGLTEITQFSSTGAGAAVGVTGQLTGSSTQQKGLSIGPTVGQSGTAGYKALYISPYESSTGSGGKLLIDAGINSAANMSGTHTSKFYVGSDGKLTTLGIADVYGTYSIFGGDYGASTRTNNTLKAGGITMPHYTNSEEPVVIFAANSYSGGNDIEFGGGDNVVNAATNISFRTASNGTTVNGSTRMRINGSGNVLIGSTTDSGGGEKLQVTGASKLSGNVSVTGTLTASTALEVTSSSGGVFLKSPDGTRYKLTVSNAGALVITATP